VQKRDFVPAEDKVDFVVLEEVTNVVKYESMNLVDNLLMVNTPQKMAQKEIVKKHKHVVFADEPIRPEPKKLEPKITVFEEVKTMFLQSEEPRPKKMRLAEMPIEVPEEPAV